MTRSRCFDPVNDDLARQCARVAAAANLVRRAMPAMARADFPGPSLVMAPIAAMLDSVVEDLAERWHPRLPVGERRRRYRLRAVEWPSILEEIDGVIGGVLARHRRLAERFSGHGPERALYDEIRRIDDARVFLRSLALEFEDLLVERRI